MRLLLDEMYAPAIAGQLSKSTKIDAIALGDMRGASDEAVLAFAAQQRRAVVTENVSDFIPLANQRLASGQVFAGLVLTSNRSFPRAVPGTTGALVKSLHALARRNPELTDRVVWLQPVERG